MVGTELKPCPFCGSDGVMFQDYRFINTPDDFWLVYGAMCSNSQCIAHQGEKFYKTEYDARLAWNTRVGDNQNDKNTRK